MGHPTKWTEARCRELTRLNAQGTDDLGVSARLGCTHAAARWQRIKLGLPAVPKNSALTLIRINKSPAKRAKVAATMRSKLDALLLAPETIARVQAWRADCVIWREIAARLGVGEEALKDRRERMGFLPKGRALPTDAAEIKQSAKPEARISAWLLAPDMIEQVTEWRRRGMSWDAIAKLLRVSPTTLAARRGQMGLEAPPRLRKPEAQAIKAVASTPAKMPDPLELTASIARTARILRDPPPVRPQRARPRVEPLFASEPRLAVAPARPKLGQDSWPGSVLAGVLIHPAHRRA